MRSEFLTQTESTPDHLRALSAELAAAVLLSCVLLQVAVFCLLLCAFLYIGMSFASGPDNNRKLSLCRIGMSFFSQKCE